MESRKRIIWDPPTYWGDSENLSEPQASRLHDETKNEDNYNNNGSTTTHQQHPHHEEKKVEWIELLFDLVFVVVVAHISHLALAGIMLTLNHQEQAVLSCSVMGGGGGHDDGYRHQGHRRLLHDHNDYNSHNDHNSTHTSPAPHHEEPSIPFGLSPALEKGASSIIYYLLAMRIWTRQAKMVSSRKGGLDIIGRILFFLTIWAFGGMSTAMGEGFASSGHFDQVITGFTVTRFLQLLDYLRLYRNSITIQRMWGRYAYLPSVVELIGCLLTLALWSLNVKREVGVLMVIASYFSGIPTKLCISKFAKTDLKNNDGGTGSIQIQTETQEESPRLRIGSLDVASTAMTNSLSSIHVHHYAERWGLALIIVIGEGFAQVINSQSNELYINHLQDTRTSRIFGSLLSLLILLPFFWLYFDSIDPNVLLDKERASIAQMSHLFLFLSLSILATALNTLLKIWMCNVSTSLKFLSLK